MNRITKNIPGQLLDMSSKLMLSESLVNITLIDPQRPEDRPSYKVSLTVEGYHPELDNKNVLLKLSDDIIGEIFLSISTRVSPGGQTHFIVNLQDNIWNNLEWFTKI